MEERHLFLVRTPLQAKIAARLMDGLRRTDAACRIDLLFIAPKDNAITRHYFQVASAGCDRTFFCEYRDGKKWSRQTARHFARLLCTPYQTVFLASIDEFLFRILLPRLTFAAVETFDDGSNNLLPDSRYRETASDWKRLRRRLRREWTTDIIRNLSRRHHTIYPNMPNIVTPTVALDLWRYPEGEGQCRVVRRILLGQSIFGLDENIACRDRLIEIFRPDVYVPHPAERNLPDFPLLETDLIIEDYIEGQLRENPELCFEVATFFSSAAFHLFRQPGVTVKAYCAAEICNRYPLVAQVYALMEQMGIDIIDLDECRP